MKYKVTEITGAKESNGQIRTAFKVQGDGRTISTFHDKALSVGQEIEGNIVDKTKDGKTFHNFYFDDASGKLAPQTNVAPPTQDSRISAIQTTLGKIDFKLDSIIRTQKALIEGKPVPKFDYPLEESEGMGNFGESTPKDLREVDPDNIPF